MWRNLVVATALLVGGFCLEALCAKDGGFTGSETGAVHSSAMAESDDSAEVLLSGETSSSEPTTPVDSGPRRRGLGARRTNEPRTTGLRRPEPKLSDFAGLWRGEAVDYPEDGTSTDPVGIKLTVSESGKLEGVAFDEFAGGDETPLEDVYVAADRIEFKVRHRTGVKMRVTLGLAGNTLKGEGIPIRSDEDRCDIVLERSEQRDQPRGKAVDAELAGAKGFDGRWVGVVKDRPEKGEFRRSLIVDVSVDKPAGTIQIITMGGYQQSYDDHIDDAKVQNGKLAFQLMDREGVTATISLWSRPGEKNKLWGEAVPPDGAAPVRDVELTRADDRREYTHWGGHRRLVVDPSLLPASPDSGEHSSQGPASRFR